MSKALWTMFYKMSREKQPDICKFSVEAIKKQKVKRLVYITNHKGRGTTEQTQTTHNHALELDWAKPCRFLKDSI